MARRAAVAVVSAALWLLLLALAHQGEAARLLTEDVTAAADGGRVLTEVDNRLVDFSRSDCGPLGKHKYRCVPPMKTSEDFVDLSVEDNRPVDYTGSDCGPLGQHKYRCPPPVKNTAPVIFDSSEEDKRPLDFTGSDCGPLGKHKYRCVPPMKTIDEAAPVLDDSSVEDIHALDNPYSPFDCILGRHKLRCGGPP